MINDGLDVGIEGETEESRMPPEFLAWTFGELGSHSPGKEWAGARGSQGDLLLLDLPHYSNTNHLGETINH